VHFLLLQHEAASPPALFGEWSRERGHVCHIVDVPALVDWNQLRDFDAVVSLGSDTSVERGAEPWIAAEIAFLRQAHGRGVPLLGICFGGQALAAALGGSVCRADFLEAGWSTVAAEPPLTDGPWFRWHEDVFSVPPGARELARSKAGPLAFAIGSSVGLQIHPETTAAVVEGWIEGARQTMVEERIDEARLRSEVAAAAPGARRRAFALFDRVEQHWLDSDGFDDGRPDRTAGGRMRTTDGDQ
jgi:GMP synthase-like glutamine amidotransferase